MEAVERLRGRYTGLARTLLEGLRDGMEGTLGDARRCDILFMLRRLDRMSRSYGTLMTLLSEEDGLELTRAMERHREELVGVLERECGCRVLRL